MSDNKGLCEGKEYEWFLSLSTNLTAESRAAFADTLANRTDAPYLPEGKGTALNRISERLMKFYVDQTEAASPSAPAKHKLVDALAKATPAPVSSPMPTPTPATAPTTRPPITIDDPALREAIIKTYQLTVSRTPAEKEIEIWLNNLSHNLPFYKFVNLLANSEEANTANENANKLGDLADVEFIECVYRHLENRGALPNEIDHFRNLILNGAITRDQMVSDFFVAAIKREESGADNQVHDGLSCQIMGVGKLLTLDEWKAQSNDKDALEKTRKALDPKTPFTVSPRDEVLRVSAITSLFRGGEFIEQFMDNMASQTIFDKYTELLIIDADSPENEAETIERYTKNHPNIRYKRMNHCVGIYEAWNIGVEMSRGKYLTNANLDDLRREDSFEIQAGALDAMPFVDVVYQDFFYSFAPDMSWEEVASYGHKSDLPVVTPYNMLRFNSPHNAPMWRRNLHDEMGLFDSSMKSAGDYEFWMRCMTKQKTFFKVNEPHVVYYQNPKGLSTRADTRGVIEAREVTRRYSKDLISDNFRVRAQTLGTEIIGLEKDESAKFKNRNAIAQEGLMSFARKAKQNF